MSVSFSKIHCRKSVKGVRRNHLLKYGFIISLSNYTIILMNTKSLSACIINKNIKASSSFLFVKPNKGLKNQI